MKIIRPVARETKAALHRRRQKTQIILKVLVLLFGP